MMPRVIYKWNRKGMLQSEDIINRYGSRLKFERNGCWTLTGYKQPNGYSMIGIGKSKKKYAHRVFYEAFRGKIKKGLSIDHLCRNRGCVNPLHLEPVTMDENLKRGNGRTFMAWRSNQCTKGHPMSGNNLYVSPSGNQRACRQCRKDYYQNVTKKKGGSP